MRERTLEASLPTAVMKTPAAAAYVGLAISTMEKGRVAGLREATPPYLKIGRGVAYLKADLDAWLASRRRGSTSELTP